jgi:rhodanese-related sulfurtransferase
MAEIPRISPQEAFDKTRDQGYTYVDVRTEPEFAEGHPDGAVNVPLGRIDAGGVVPNDDFLPVMLALFAKDAKLVVGCKSGRSSLRATETLASSGFTCVVEQRAGWDGVRDAFGQLIEPGWWRAGLPTAEGTPSGRCYGDLAARAQRSFARS